MQPGACLSRLIRPGRPARPVQFRRCFHSSKPAPSATPEWLSRVLQDESDAPRLYRRTAGGHAPGKRTPSGDAGRRIYVVGVGNLGRLFAAALARSPQPPPITLVVHRPGLLAAWRENPGLWLHPQGYAKGAGTRRDAPIVDVDVEMWTDAPEHGEEEIGPIANLIVATKAPDALPTVDRLRRYLGAGSTVAFAQNGMSKLWPPYGAVYSAARYAAAGPNWVACVVTHGVYSLGPFESVHASPADVVLGSVNEDVPRREQPHLVQRLLEAPVLSARWVQRPELWVMQVEKLVVNAVINPLTAILRCQNGVLFGYANDDSANGSADGRAERQGAVLVHIIDQLVTEASAVLTALAVHELREGGVLADTADAEALVQRLSPEKLRDMVYRVGGVVRDNTSSMLQDVLANRGTEVGEFNGWLVDMARYLASIDGATGGIDVPAHQTVVDLVKGGTHLSREQLGDYF